MTDIRRIATHEPPSLDTLVAVWLARRYLLMGESSEVVFFPPGHPLYKEDMAWCAEPGFTPALEINWGRKRLSFPERYAASATGQLWAHLLSMGRPVPHLIDLVDAVHAGATGLASRGTPWSGLASRLGNFWRKATAAAGAAGHLCRAACAWLDEYESGLGSSAVKPAEWGRVAERFPRLRGTYVLVLETAAPGVVLVGRTGSVGRFQVQPGYDAYTGSACGSGGLFSRLRRHLTPARELPLKWQVDFLRMYCSVVEVWYTAAPLTSTPLARECAWADCVSLLPGATVPHARFGATDCGRHAHLAHFEGRPDFEAFKSLVARTLGGGRPCQVVVGEVSTARRVSPNDEGRT